MWSRCTGTPAASAWALRSSDGSCWARSSCRRATGTDTTIGRSGSDGAWPWTSRELSRPSTSWLRRRRPPVPSGWESASTIRWPCISPTSVRRPRISRASRPCPFRAARTDEECPSGCSSWARATGTSGCSPRRPRASRCCRESSVRRTAAHRDPHGALRRPTLRGGVARSGGRGGGVAACGESRDALQDCGRSRSASHEVTDLCYVPAIGFEVHARLGTRTKLFCGCPNASGGEPNSRVCPVCLGLPGALPVLNRRALELGLRVALALGARVAPVTAFDRKSYFYPDLPKGFQITQKARPLARGGGVLLPDGGRIRLRQIHIEEDAGKTIHRPGPDDVSLVDMNRCGAPLVEVVTEPDIASVEQADVFLRELRRTLVFAGVTAGRMHEGEMRFDSNISVSPRGESGMGAPTEIKNLNSFRAVRRALEREIERQTGLLDSGRAVPRETMSWDEAAGRAVPTRSKEASKDYRYIAEPDLPEFPLTGALLERARSETPELPRRVAERFAAEYGLSSDDASLLARTKTRAALFELAVVRARSSLSGSLDVDIGEAMSLVVVVVPGILNALGLAPDGRLGAPRHPGRSLTVNRLADEVGDLLAARARGELSAASGREALEQALKEGRSVRSVMSESELSVMKNRGQLTEVARSVLGSMEDEVRRFLSGEARLRKHFIGEIMRRTRGRADPEAAIEALDRELEELRESE
ncbi:MAG: Asp-tRNA(Asn)/Glu-tRNA(Gln) amidotransferase subunit GatB [Candidatus Eisenbacteria bacterium]|nr:Asp-tRNA(Asn)/Glu-tRNA(Gln) amidotransferase subunit GatB [Candidatus Eisenbacteria bacterium]